MTTETVLIVGNTYPVREQLKALGGRWDNAAKGWRVPSEKAAEARALLPAAPVRHASSRPRRAPCGYPGCRYYGDPLCDECSER